MDKMTHDDKSSLRHQAAKIYTEDQARLLLSNDGTIETPNLGTIKLNTQNNKVVWNGEVIGEATKTSAIC